MAAPLLPLPRLQQLARAQGHTPKVLAGVIGRSESYMRRRFTADTYLLDLPIEELTLLAAFYGIPVGELGG